MHWSMIIDLQHYLQLVYFHPYEVAGRMWPRIFSRIIVGLLIFEVMSSGLFLLQKAYPLAVLCGPLIIFTIVFKLTMDAAYLRSTRFLPLQLLTQRLGVATTAIDGPDSPPNNQQQQPPQPQPSTSERSSRRVIDANGKVLIRRRRTVLDQDDYVAEPTKYTDYRQPPMTLVDGILNTGMKKYGHPALLGALPQLWLPVAKYRRQSIYSDIEPGVSPKPTATTTNIGRMNNNNDGNSICSSPLARSPLDICASLSIGDIDINGERRPLLAAHPEEEELEEGSSIDSSSSDEVQDGRQRTMYYHHPERRQSRLALSSSSRSYGALYNHPNRDIHHI